MPKPPSESRLPLTVVDAKSLPDPPYSPDTRADGWKFEMDYIRIFMSRTWTKAPWDVQNALLRLWLVAWAQSPCGALPNDDEAVADMMGMPVHSFKAQRDLLLRGWELHSDGMFYHHVVTERVLVMEGQRVAGRKRKADWRARKKIDSPDKQGLSNDGNAVSHDGNAGHIQDNMDVSRSGHTTGTGTGTGTGITGAARDVGGAAPPPPLPAGERLPASAPLFPPLPVEETQDPPVPPSRPPPAKRLSGSPPHREEDPGESAAGAKRARAIRLPKDWRLPAAWGKWALAERPNWSAERVREVAATFRDYWIAKSGKDATKIDWEATWRNWVRKENVGGSTGPPLNAYQQMQVEKHAQRKQFHDSIHGRKGDAKPTRDPIDVTPRKLD